MTVDAYKSLKTKELEEYFLELEKTPSKRELYPEIFKIFAEIVLTEQIPTLDRLSLRASFPPELEIESDLYPASAYFSALIGTRSPYYSVYGITILQNEAVSETSHQLVNQFQAMCRNAVLTKEDFIRFEQAWEQYEIQYLGQFKTLLLDIPTMYKGLGFQGPILFFQNFPYFFNKTLQKAVFDKAKAVSSDHILYFLAQDLVNSVKELRLLLQNFTYSFTSSFPAPIQEQVDECVRYFRIFSDLEADLSHQKWIDALVEAARSYPEVYNGTMDERASLLLPQLALFSLRSESDPRVLDILLERETEIVPLEVREAAKEIIQEAYQLHSQAAERMTVSLQIVERLFHRHHVVVEVVHDPKGPGNHKNCSENGE